jgi:putative NADH-flavin reductase
VRIFVLGATGRTGRPLLDQAKERGHDVTAFVRSPDKLAGLAGVTVRRGDPRNEAELREAIAGHDAVVSALGPVSLGASTILGDAARATVAAMKEAGPKRLLVVSAAMLFDDAGMFAAFLRRTFLRNVAKDSLGMEAHVTASHLDWTIVRPPRLTTGPLTSKYVVADGAMPKDGTFVTSRADVACFLLDELERPAHVRKIVGMGGQ